jgi:hypothetical protein
MTESLWTRVGPATGILGWVVALVGHGIHGYPTTDASKEALARWVAATNPNQFAIGIYVEAIGVLLLLVFFAWLSDYLRRRGAPVWLVAVGLGGAILWVGGAILDNGLWTAMLDAGKRGVDLQALAGFRDAASEVGTSIYLFIALALIAVGLAALRPGAMPFWLSWTVVAIGLALAIPALLSIAGLLLVLWVLAVSVQHLIRPGATTSPT